MAFEWPLDKLSLINSALAMTGDNLVAAPDNGSDEWTVASPAYERGLAFSIESHSWGFATLVTPLTPSPIAPADTDWDTAYPLPSDLVQLIWAKINANTSTPSSSFTNHLTIWGIEVVGGKTCLVTNAQGGPPPPPTPVTPAQITIKYISNQGALADPTSGTPTLILALQSFVMAGIYRGLQQDPAEGDKMWQAGTSLLQDARTRYDQQKPKRQFFNSRIAAARRVRRPWPPVGTGNWGSGSGNGIPG
jgi:hypothetical protein